MRLNLNQDMTNFMTNCNVPGVLPGVIVNDNRIPSGRTPDAERLRRIKGLEIRDDLIQAIVNHNIHRLSRDNGW